MEVNKSLIIKLCAVSVLSLFLCQLLTAQTNKVQNRRAFWYSRAEEITYDSLKDIVFLSSFEQSVVYARLGEAWWKEKPEQARIWLLKAFYTVETIPNQENPAEKQQRLATARFLFKITSRLDKNLSDRLLSLFTSEVNGSDENQQVADALIESALALIDKNPQRAVDLGKASMRFGRSNSFASLVWQLQVRNSDLASNLFLSALTIARETRNERWLSLLGFTAFSEADDSNNLSSALPKTLQTELLKMYLEPLQGVPVNEENQDRLCGYVSSFIIPYQGKFTRLLPSKSEQINSIIARCQTVFSALEKEEADQSSELRSLKTIEDYLSAADDEEDLQVKTVYQYKAAQMAFRGRNYGRAIAILDSMSEESRRLMRGTWEGHRWEWAADFAFQLFKQDAELEMNQILEKVPLDLRGFAQVALADKVSGKMPAMPFSELLYNAQKNLARSQQPDRERIEGYLILMRLYAQHKKVDEATDTLKEIIKIVNQYTLGDKKSGLSVFLENEKLFLEGIPAIMFERREYAVKEAISSITFLPKRILTRLELLSLCLAEYKTLSTSSPKN